MFIRHIENGIIFSLSRNDRQGIHMLQTFLIWEFELTDTGTFCYFLTLEKLNGRIQAPLAIFISVALRSHLALRVRPLPS